MMSIRSEPTLATPCLRSGGPLLADFAGRGDFPVSKEDQRTANDAASQKGRRERRRALIVPREHGAWGLLLVPMITGAGVGFREYRHIFPLILLTTAALALFWLRTPVESLLGTSAMRAESSDERSTVRSFVLGLVGVAAVALGALLWAGHNTVLWPLGAAVAAAFIAQALLKKLAG